MFLTIDTRLVSLDVLPTYFASSPSTIYTLPLIRELIQPIAIVMGIIVYLTSLSGNLFFRCGTATVILITNFLNTSLQSRLPLASQVQEHRLDRMCRRLPALPDRENTHTERAEEEPHDSNDNPACILVSNILVHGN